MIMKADDNIIRTTKEHNTRMISTYLINEDEYKEFFSMDDMKKRELSDAELDTVVGGYEIGQKVRCNRWSVEYCPKCGKLLLNYEATITGIRGELDGKTLYWVTFGCCGYKSCVIETAIVG